MKTSKIILSMMLISVLLVPAMVGAQAVNWSALTYEAESIIDGYPYNDSNYTNDVSIGSSGTQSSILQHSYETAISEVTSTYFDIYTKATPYSHMSMVTAVGGWWGEYTAQNTEFVLDYAYSYIANAPDTTEYYRSLYNMGGMSLDITVTDMTTSEVLLNRNHLMPEGAVTDYNPQETGSGGEILRINTTPGNVISVSMVATNHLETYDGVSFWGGENDLLVTYNASVAPEPVSTTLFILGGVLMAGRGYMRQRQNIT
ncbi:MAG: hypothetical protein ISR96_07540 [Nitrospira sp.]|nr:hypothetical protein [Nitrospira sp.]